MREFYRGKKVLVTGHTGFKGAWLSHILLSFGAQVVGLSLPPERKDDIFVKIDLYNRVTNYEFDIRESAAVMALVKAEAPDIVFHLAAQPLVRRSYDEPLYTVTTNVVGTANILEAVRKVPSVQSVVVITTDKVYENKEWFYGYRENDPLGGYDPYSGSKAAADIVAEAYRRSFFNESGYGSSHRTLIAIARAGNVIGGGDWAFNRLVPDIMRSVFYGNGSIAIRNPYAVRPWEHVLEPLAGYLMLAMGLARGQHEYSGAWNFGPEPGSWLSVADVSKRVLELLGTGSLEVVPDQSKHESGMLALDTSKARRILQWSPRFSIEETIEKTVTWYKTVHENPDRARAITEEQIATYFNRSE